MGTSIENGRGGSGVGEEEVEEEVIPWSCVDEAIRKELIMRLNPELGYHWRDLAGELDYTSAQILAIESEKGNNTRELFNSYTLRANSTFNKVFRALQNLERVDCVKILEKYMPRIRKNFENEKKVARQLEEDLSNPGPCLYHYPQTAQHSIGLRRSCSDCTCGGPVVAPPAAMVSHHHSHGLYAMPPAPPSAAVVPPHATPHHNHNSYNSHPHRSHSHTNGGYPSSPCCHMTHHPLQMSPMGSCMAAGGGGGVLPCSNQSSTNNGSYPCSHQSSCTAPHLQMDISSSIPKCNAGYYYSSGPPTPSVVNHSNIAFADQPQAGIIKSNLPSATSPTSCQYYNGRDPSFSPKISPDTNSKPYNFTNSDYHQNIMVTSRAGGEADHPVSNNFTSQYSNEYNGSYPSTIPASHYESSSSDIGGVGGAELQRQHQMSNQLQQQQHLYQNIHHPKGSIVGGGTSSAVGATAAVGKLELDPRFNNNMMADSKKSLQKLAEISKMPNKYQPTDEYKTIVAEQDVDYKKRRSRSARHNGSNMVSRFSSSSTASSASSSSQADGTTVTKNHNQPEEVSQMAGLSLATNSPQAMRSNVYVTYSKDNEKHKKEVLLLTVFLNDNNNSVWADVANDTQEVSEGIEPYQEYYNLADFILVCLSPKYLQDIARPASSHSSSATIQKNSHSSPNSSNTPTPTSLPIHTYEIYQMMKEEHIATRSGGGGGGATRSGGSGAHNSSNAHSASAAAAASTALNGCTTNNTANISNTTANPQQDDSKVGRFVCLLFGDMNIDQVPAWLRRYPVYKWPQDYEHIGWFLKRPRAWVCGAQANSGSGS